MYSTAMVMGRIDMGLQILLGNLPVVLCCLNLRMCKQMEQLFMVLKCSNIIDMDDELNNVQEQSPYLSLGVIVEAHNNHWRFKDTNVRII